MLDLEEKAQIIILFHNMKSITNLKKKEIIIGMFEILLNFNTHIKN